jgi:hypothetical protein
MLQIFLFKKLKTQKHGVKLTSQNCRWTETCVNVANSIIQKVENAKTLCKVDDPEVPID